MKPLFRIQTIVLIVIGAFAMPLKAQQDLEWLRDAEGVSVSEWQDHEVAHASRKIKIKLDSNADKSQAVAAVEHLAALYEPEFNDLGWGFFEVEDEDVLFETIRTLKENPLFEIVEPVFVGMAGVVPNDPDYQLQWHLNNTGQSPTNGTTGADIAAEHAWDLTTGDSDVVIAILDTGIPMQNDQLSHEDLQQSNRYIL